MALTSEAPPHQECRAITRAVALLAALALAGPGVAILGAWPTSASDGVTLRVHNPGPPRGLLKPLEIWAEQVTERTEGQVQFEFLWGGVLGSAEDQIDNIEAGTFEIGALFPSFLSGKAPLMSSGELPLMTSDVVALGKATLEWAEMPEIQAEMEGRNQRILFFTVAPDQEYWGVKPIRTIGDFEGLRGWAGGVFGRALEALGGTPILVPVSEIGTGLQRGTFDGVFTGMHLHQAQETYLFSQYRVTPGFGAGVQVISINLDAWNGLSPEVHQIMMEEAQKVPEMYLDIYGSIETDLQEKSAGTVEHIVLDPEVVDQIVEIAGRPIWDAYIAEQEAQGVPAGKVVHRLLDLIDKYESHP